MSLLASSSERMYGTLDCLQPIPQLVLVIIWVEINAKLPGYLSIFLNLKCKKYAKLPQRCL